ncbi:hypothetical protein A3I42_02015 [Candidatus Uhrbacteria bacterium RIFCSPLOWO2_02_FULL_49_11]|uniref:Uncharacterized protein n=1 Tax=Candidatus Uhrbacteria bacterium RIFCSPLOWO2_02_FULL_49_11 TaxID=1802409 RepID=A0A1F7VDW4_9BACT|nr:MAG: hypothetical protein A3I42_02015 [Candidatus Uhrbacteria bacterium RIFCSPLOWO2_02_FULL_49_11]
MKRIVKRRTIKSRVKKFKYSVPDEVLERLVDLLHLWGYERKTGHWQHISHFKDADTTWLINVTQEKLMSLSINLYFLGEQKN